MNQSSLPSQTTSEVTGAPPALSQPTVESVLHLLDSEIEEIQSAEARNGLNVWVVLAAVVGLLWLLTGELRPGGADWPGVIRLVLTTSIFIDALVWLHLVLTIQSKGNDEVRFHWSHYSLGTRRAYAAIALLHCVVLLLLALFSHAVHHWTLVPVVVFFSVSCFLMLITFAGSFKPLFVVSPGFRNNFTYAFWVLLFGSSFAALTLLVRMLPVPTERAITDYRISGLIVGIGYLLVMLGRVLSSSSLVPTLVEVRRKLATGKMSLNDAIHQIEITLGGMQVTNALRDEIFQLMSLLDAMDQQTNNAMIAISSIESNLPSTGDDPSIAVNKQGTVNSLIAGYKAFLDQRQILFNRYVQQLAGFNKLAAKIKVMPSARSSVNEIERLINSRAVSTDQNFSQLQAKEAEADKKLKQPRPATAESEEQMSNI